jgi:hypothetical protein
MSNYKIKAHNVRQQSRRASGLLRPAIAARSQ